MILFGVLIYGIKFFLPIDIESWTRRLQTVVGVSLIVVGGMGVKEVNEELQGKNYREDDDHHHIDLKNPRVSILTGVWQGFTGSGHFAGVMPAITLPSLVSAFLYLCIYCLGTMIAMAGFCGIVGMTSKQMIEKGGKLNPLNFAFYASCFSIVVGILMVLFSLLLD